MKREWNCEPTAEAVAKIIIGMGQSSTCFQIYCAVTGRKRVTTAWEELKPILIEIARRQSFGDMVLQHYNPMLVHRLNVRVPDSHQSIAGFNVFPARNKPRS